MCEQITDPPASSSPLWEQLERWARGKIQEWFQGLLEQEVTEFLGRAPSARRPPVDARPGYRNGFGKPRRLSLSMGTIRLRRPRVRGLTERFESRLLPLFKRRTEEVGQLLPELYLHGLSQGDFELALRGLLGEGAPLSASSLARLREQWVADYEQWRQERIEEEIVYLWADGLYVKAGLEKEKAALLVVIGARGDGTKRILAVEAGVRESTASWAAVLRGLRERGLGQPVCVVADGHLGIWAALREIGWEGAEQRCWNHKLVNVLDQIPRTQQRQAGILLKSIPYAETEREAVRLRDRFAERFGRPYPKAVETLRGDWDRMVTFYRFPKEHWKHLRTTNVVESPFAAVRLRTTAAKRFKKVQNATALIWRTLMVAEKRFRRVTAPHLLVEVARGVRFVDGIRVSSVRKDAAA